MFRLSLSLMRTCSSSLLVIFLSSALLVAQVETATVSGQVVDSSGLRVARAQVDLVDIDRGTGTTATTDNSGLYRFASVHPGLYRVHVRAPGFRVIDVTGLTVNVQDHLEQNFRLTVGSVSESVTVEGGAPLVDVETGTVSTAVNRQFADNLPMNGRSFQTLIELTPGVVPTQSTYADAGQFSINGQRASANYWTVDGVSANIGVSTNGNLGNGAAGAVGGFSAQGGTNSLVSVDALQEFRIQTSTFAPEFGRTPGGQISIATRSGTNQFHGTLSDYFRNDVLDANDWFADHKGLAKAKERQNDFGGIVGGPIFKDRTFFFLSYEGLRLRLPQTGLSTVPSLSARQVAIPAMKPFMNAYPVPNGSASGIDQAQFNKTYSDPSTLDAVSLRIDDRIHEKLSFFGRYNYSPSQVVQRGGGLALSNLQSSTVTTQTATLGTTWTPAPSSSNDLRFNYSRVEAQTRLLLDGFGGAASPAASAIPFPAPYNSGNSFFSIINFGLTNGSLSIGKSQRAVQRQLNVIDSFSWQHGSHSFKFGVDFRRLSPVFDPYHYLQNNFFFDVPSAEVGTIPFYLLRANRGATLLFRNLGVFAQDAWREGTRLTITYGLRWDMDFAPVSTNGPSLAAASNFNINNLSTLAIAPAGTAPFQTTYVNFAPRLGAAYQLRKEPKWQTVLRGGGGVFYDLATQEVGQETVGGQFPFGAAEFLGGAQFPLSGSNAEPPVISAANLRSLGNAVFLFDPKLNLPYTLQWNVALDQSFGINQVVSISYIGSAGRRLTQTQVIAKPNLAFSQADIVRNASTSDYDALQIQFQKRVSHGLNILASYSWAHSIDTGSASSIGSYSNVSAPNRVETNRGPSDFDIRHAFTTGLNYDIPTPKQNRTLRYVAGGWALQTLIQARSAPPVDVFYSFLSVLSQDLATIRPDLVPGQPIYLHGTQYPGEMGFNAAAFTAPPEDAADVPIRQGDLGRNALRGFHAIQWDFGVHREFKIGEWMSLQFRSEFFNVLNHPNFGSPEGNLQSPQALNPQFGVSTMMLGRSLNGTNGSGLSPLYQVGGPRSVQFALKLTF